ncbi:hypothetical protein NPIL_292191 [Nephila pilipes]|uniref:Uncharacterized protein n=1 Tax=Nephila pilipes TaxID=299642 RepID=A0A8X6SZL3_NEPPI|nr:hypothetical protein NPIL_292191 [Nephila pilipes]
MFMGMNCARLWDEDGLSYLNSRSRVLRRWLQAQRGSTTIADIDGTRQVDDFALFPWFQASVRTKPQTRTIARLFSLPPSFNDPLAPVARRPLFIGSGSVICLNNSVALTSFGCLWRFIGHGPSSRSCCFPATFNRFWRCSGCGRWICFSFLPIILWISAARRLACGGLLDLDGAPESTSRSSLSWYLALMLIINHYLFGSC